MVSARIQELLYENDCVIIPDFGGLIAQYAPARIHPVKHTVTPPSKKIAFNEKLNHNDGLLISSLARHLQVPTAEAQNLVSSFVSALQHDLNHLQQCELKGIGVFRYNTERKIEFEYLAGDNFLENSFGLPELVARPVIPAEAAAVRAMRYQKPRPDKVPAKNKLNRFIDKYATVAGTILLGSLTVSLIYLVSLQTDYNLSSLNPAALFQRNAQTETVPEKTVPLVPESSAYDYLNSLPVTPEDESVRAIEQDSAYVVYGQPEPEIITEQPSDLNEPLQAKTLDAATVPVPNRPENEAAKIAAKAPVAPEKKENSTVKPEKLPAVNTEAKPAARAVAATPKPTEKIIDTKKPAAAIKIKTGRYFIIFGGFASKENAQRCQQDLNAKGAASDLILPTSGNKLHRVSVAEFQTMELAAENLPALRNKYGNALWILNY